MLCRRIRGEAVDAVGAEMEDLGVPGLPFHKGGPVEAPAAESAAFSVEFGRRGRAAHDDAESIENGCEQEDNEDDGEHGQHERIYETIAFCGREEP